MADGERLDRHAQGVHLKLLVLGAGSAGLRHAMSGQALGLEVGIMDVDAARAAASAAKAGASMHFDGLDQALAWKPDAVVVATPHIHHVSQAIAALRSGADILVEKPISDRVERAAELLAAERQSGRKAFVVCNMRFHPAVAALHDNIDRAGAVRYARAHYGNYLPNMRPGADYRTLYCARADTGGGVMLDAIHEIDYLMWLLGPVTAVQGANARLSDLDIDVEDFANIVLAHGGGARSVITLDYLRPWKRRGCEIVGEKGLLLWESEGKQPERCSVRFYDAVSQHWDALFDCPDLDTNRPYIDMLDDFVGAINGRPHKLQTAADAVERLAVTVAARAQSLSPLAQAHVRQGINVDA
jgi:predicted dehydrogenase